MNKSRAAVIRMVRRAYLRALYRRGGIEAINRRLLRVDRVEEILIEFGASIGRDTVLHGPLVIHNAKGDYHHLEVGDDVHVGRLVILDLAERVVLERETVISMGCTILTHSDVGDRALAKSYPRRTASVRIGPGASLGANVTVLAGCTIGSQAVVGAGAVVTRTVPDETVAAGVPARPVSGTAAGLQIAESGSADPGPCQPERVDVVDDV
jgi:maltose O-acetyltransferase